MDKVCKNSIDTLSSDFDMSLSENKRLTNQDRLLKLREIQESIKNQKLYSNQEAWLLAVLEWNIDIPEETVRKYFEDKKNKLEQSRLAKTKLKPLS